MDAKRIFMPENFTISQESLDQSWTMPYSHYHDSYEIYILENGSRTVTVGDKDYTVNAYDATLFNKNTPHKSKGISPFSGICIHILDRYLDFYFSVPAKKHLLECFRHTVISLNSSEFKTIKDIADNFTLNAPNNFIYLADILNILNLASTAAPQEISPHSDKLSAAKSQLILQYVNDNYVFIKNIMEIANLFDVSESYIFKIFKRKYNMTPKQYINKLKLLNICHRLKYTDGTVKAIAFDGGFDCYEYFIRVFKKNIGCTPSEYRNAHLNKE